MSTTAQGLQKQLDALASFSHYRQLDVNHSKTKVVIFETRHSGCQEFIYNGIPVERQTSYKYLGFTFHATKNMAYGVNYLVAAAKKAMHALQRRCAFLHLSDPAVKCNLFDALVLPMLVRFGQLIPLSVMLVKFCTGSFCDSYLVSERA